MIGSPIRFLCDENVQKAVADFLRHRGHEVIMSRDVLAAGAPDQMLAVLGRFESLVIITHDNDFKKYRQMLPDHLRNRFTTGAGRIWLDVPYTRTLVRIQEEIRQIEFAYAECVTENRPLIMTIQKGGTKLTRS